ncbi:aldehyde dehydrogenase family protein [Nitratidesulfovibrio termitidis]|uniref:aldehyde dehydrogenase family protein n=1 Tax=Nitratidesulfovibrio termitidis TaxID=42252 RepID=UPI00041E1BE5|nr:aldehyde dehydrogenase family protein [Nitratidesulfovibrio termitidis]
MTQSAAHDVAASVSASGTPAPVGAPTASSVPSATDPSVIGEDMAALAARQAAFIASGAVLPSGARVDALRRLREGVQGYRDRLADAIRADYGRPEHPFLVREVVPVLHEIDWLIKAVPGFCGGRRVLSSLGQFKARSYVRRQPLGRVVTYAHWADPFRSLLVPLADAVGAGNAVVLRPTAEAPATAEMVARMVRQYFEPEHVAVVSGGAETDEALLAAAPDFVWYDGDTRGARTIAALAAPTLTPYAAITGGPSAALVHGDADIAMAARRIVWAKFLHAGQVRAAPDVLLVQRTVLDRVLDALRTELERAFGPQPRASADFGRMVSAAGFVRQAERLAAGRTLPFGPGDAPNQADRASLYVPPALITDVPDDSPVLREEGFGPVLVVRPYTRLDEATALLAGLPALTALYAFTTAHARGERLMETTRAGAVLINDAATHLANPRLPQGGVGEAGYGAVAGPAGLATFSAPRAAAVGSNFFDIPLRFAPGSDLKLKLLKRLYK